MPTREWSMAKAQSAICSKTASPWRYDNSLRTKFLTVSAAAAASPASGLGPSRRCRGPEGTPARRTHRR